MRSVYGSGQLFVAGGVSGDWLNVYVQGSGDDARFSVDGWGGTTAACPLVPGHPWSRWFVPSEKYADKEAGDVGG
jgi:hypothetical protein